MLPRMCEPNDPLMALGNAMGNFIISDPMPFFFSCIAIWLQDHDMHRGKPLYLSQERYAALTYLVVGSPAFINGSISIIRNFRITCPPFDMIGGISQP